MSETSRIPPGVDPTKPSPARIYDYVLGGTHNFPVDRAAAERIRVQSPDLQDAAWVNRGFHQRAARWMAGDHGIRQFIDIGSGLPTHSNTHGVVQRAIPQAHVVYVDNDPMVRAYAAELLSADETTAVVTADLREPDALLNDPALRALIDFGQPAGLLMTAVLHFVADGSDPWGLVARYVGALAPGSYLALSHITYEGLPPRLVQEGVEVYEQAQGVYPRSREQIDRFFAGLELVPPYPGADPAVTHIGLWGAEAPELADSDGSHWWYGGVARRP
ncbi:MAG TPA: SAM-dependent methyltransferase [Streptosporangiaceae bacterium]|nr:SAM-dependent methyltransferase [Streptosporangiaceae bacterium]